MLKFWLKKCALYVGIYGMSQHNDSNTSLDSLMVVVVVPVARITSLLESCNFPCVWECVVRCAILWGGDPRKVNLALQIILPTAFSFKLWKKFPCIFLQVRVSAQNSRGHWAAVSFTLLQDRNLRARNRLQGPLCQERRSLRLCAWNPRPTGASVRYQGTQVAERANPGWRCDSDAARHGPRNTAGKG